MFRKSLSLLAICVSVFANAMGQSERLFTGQVVSPRFELVPRVTITVATSAGDHETVTDENGRFSIPVPNGPLKVTLSGNNIQRRTFELSPTERIDNVELRIEFVVPPVSAVVTIEADSLTPQVEFRNDT